MKIINKDSKSVTVEFSVEEYFAFVEILKLKENLKPTNMVEIKDSTNLVHDDDLISYILNAKNRLIILQILRDQDLTAREISEITKIDINQVRRKLLELKRKELVSHNNAHQNKIYTITNLGYRILYETEKHC